MTIAGGSAPLSTYVAGIGSLAGTEGEGRLENEGTLNLHKRAINKLGTGKALVINRASGTVNAEAEAIFQNSGSTSTFEEKHIFVFSSS